MSKTLATRTSVSIAKTYGASVAMSAISNDTEAVATLASGHGVTAGDFLEITSGWGRLNERVARVKSVSGSGPYLVTLESINTSDTSKFPTGTGTGSVREITAWTNLSQIKDVSSSGGDLQFADVTDLEDVVEKKIPTIRSAVALSLTVYDDPSLAWYAVALAAAESATPAGMRATFPNGSILLANAYWSVQTTPNVAKNEAMTAKVDVSYVAAPTRYSA